MPAPLPVEVTDVPFLELADIGPFVVGGRTFYSAPTRREGAVVGPSTAGNGWSAYVLYRDHIAYAEPWEIVEVDLQTERISRFPGQTCDSWFLSVMPDGNVYTFPEDAHAKPPQAYVARINTRAGKLEIFGPGSPDSWNYCHSWGPDRAMYIGGYRQ